jgi:hypothetical protein
LACRFAEDLDSSDKRKLEHPIGIEVFSTLRRDGDLGLTGRLQHVL